MCGGSPKVDNSIQKAQLKDAREARKREEARQKRIDVGSVKIDETFDQFDDGFFTGFRDKMMALNQPELDNRFEDAGDQLTFALSRAGLGKSASAGKRRGDLQEQYDVSRAGVLADATNATANLRDQVAGERSSLVTMLNATGNADRAANQALSRSQNLRAEGPSYNPIGDVFGGLIQGVGNAFAVGQQRQIYDRYNSTGAAGSARTIP